MALIGLLTLSVGIIVFRMRRRGKRIVLTTEQEKTNEALRIAFGKNTKWGLSGGAESEMHDHANQNDHSDHSSSESSDAAD